jgi:hypothetical protein
MFYGNFDTMADYLYKLAITAADAVLTEDAMIEALLVLVVFLLPFASKPPPLATTEQSIRKILWWKFRSKSEWRGGVMLSFLALSRR